MYLEVPSSAFVWHGIHSFLSTLDRDQTEQHNAFLHTKKAMDPGCMAWQTVGMRGRKEREREIKRRQRRTMWCIYWNYE